MDYSQMTINELENRLASRDGKAICELGRRYRLGTGGAEQNFAMAYRMYHKAEKLNEKDAFLALGQMYENGEYFSRNIDIANEYYQKAGAPMVSGGASSRPTPTPSVQQTPPQWNPAPTPQPTPVSQVTSTPSSFGQAPVSNGTQGNPRSQIENLIAQAEASRSQGNISNAKNYVQQASQLIRQQGSMLGDYQRQATADVNWLYAFIAFNEQDYNSVYSYLNDNSVYEFHPWAAYLLTTVHQITNADPSVYYQDKQSLIENLNNPRLKQEELADILGMLGDLCMQGFATPGVDPLEQAYGFFGDAANAGNSYAAEQLSHFKKGLFGKLKYE